MRDLRKLASAGIAAILAVALVLTCTTAVFASDPATATNADKAATLKDLGLYAGTDATNVAAGLDGALTTQDSLIFLAKLFGYNESASRLTADQVTQALAKFDDAASVSDYAKNVVAYSAANNILSGSTKDGKFFVGAKDTVTAARFATFMLKQMGYTVPDYKTSVAKLAEIKGSKVDAAIAGDLTRDVAVGMMYGALTAEKAKGSTVIADIIGDNDDLKAKAIKAGLLEPIRTNDPRVVYGGGYSNETSDLDDSDDSDSNDSDELSIVSVKALNTKQVEIKFNAEMDKTSAQLEANYNIKDKGDVAKTLTNNSCKLGDDMKTVTITLDSTVQDCLTNASTAKVIISKDIKSASKEILGTYKEFEVEVQDGMIPTVKEVKATGERNIRITFSEPVCEGNNNTQTLNTSNFKVVSGTYTYYVQKAELNLNVINLEIGTKLIEGPITITVNNNGSAVDNSIQDYAGYKAFMSSTTFNYVKDTSVPVVTVKSARVNKVVLNFSKPVMGSNIKLYHSLKGSENYMAEATKNYFADEITFTFGQPLPSGTLKLFLVNSEIDGEKIVDGYGIKVPDQSLTCDVEIDTAAPVVNQCTVNTDESIKIVFNEELDTEAATNPESYVVKKLSDNKEIPLEAVMDDSMKSVELIFYPKLEDNTEYQLLIKEYKDISGNKNESDYEYNFTTSDNKYPEVIDNPENDQRCFAIAEKGKIFIVYSEAMKEEQMLDRANYQVSINEGYTFECLGEDDTITKVNDRIVTIYVKELEGKNDPNIKPDVKIAPIMDLAGKRLYGSIDSYIVEEIYPENVYVEEAQLIAKDKIKVVFNKKMSNVVYSDIELTGLTTPGSISIKELDSTTLNSEGKTEVVLTLDKELATDAKDATDATGVPIGITTIADPASESEWGSKLRSQFFLDLEDKAAPEIVMWDHDNDVATDDIAKVIGGNFDSLEVYESVYTVPQNATGTITIFFSEDIDGSALTTDTFNVTGFTITSISASAQPKTVILTVKANADSTPVETTVTQVLEIYDTANNAFVPVSGSTWAVKLENGPLNLPENPE